MPTNADDETAPNRIDPRAAEVLEFWFGARDGDEWGTLRKLWFAGGPAVDDEIRSRFAALHAIALAGELDQWHASAEGCLALLLVLDQFSRNLHRGTAAAFSADAKALALARQGLERRFDAQVLAVQRWFYYLPFEHSENLDDQRRAVALFSALPEEPSRAMGVDYARKHLEVIEQFGRFPHRNAMLGRESTPEEARWLAEGGARFG